jgi:glycerate 2-kinase
MKIIVAPDKFKGSISASQASQAIAEGLLLCNPTLEVMQLPMADGGEGTAEILTYHARGEMRSVTVSDPLGRPTPARFGWSGAQKTAFIEMAEASGLAMLSEPERNPLLTSSFGTGELILRAIENGAEQIILGIGGSATNDGGVGMASALGYRFLDAAGREVKPTGGNLQQISRIDDTALIFDPARLRVRVACDVDNPLTGPAGTSQMYGPQKGADAAAVQQLDAGLSHLANVFRQHFGRDVERVPGAGAAGGMGAGALLFLGAQLIPGTALVMEQTGFEQHLTGSNLLITGEGKLDRQTLHGKLVRVIAEKARVRGIPVAALCGTLDLEPQDVRELGLCFAASILRRPCTLAEAMNETYAGLRSQAFHLMQLFRVGRK